MKAIRFYHIAAITCLMAVFAGPVLSQTSVTVGQLKQNTATVTNLADAMRVLKVGLSANASIADVAIEYAPSEAAYFLIGRVLNDRVSGKAVELVNEGGILRAVAGPGVEITCTGINCASCLPNVKGMNVICQCKDIAPQSDSRCDMTSKVIVSLW